MWDPGDGITENMGGYKPPNSVGIRKTCSLSPCIGIDAEVLFIVHCSLFVDMAFFRGVDRGRSRFSWAAGMAIALLLSAALRFWDLDRFSTPVFDESYYIEFARNYLTGTAFFDAHPPLGKLAIAFGMAIAQKVSFLSTWSAYRWLNAAVGSLFPLIVAGIAFQLSHRYRYSLLAGILVAFDGSLLVESRYALINLYLFFFGFVAHYFWWGSFKQRGWRRWLWTIGSGIFLGAAIAVKWNGLGFVLGLVLTAIALRFSSLKSIVNWGRGFYLQLAFSLVLVPAIVYSLTWIPHLAITGDNFFALHQTILSYHQQTEADAHPYCSRWYAWPLVLRPIAYFYETVSPGESPPEYLPDIVADRATIIYDIHTLGNPILIWLGTLAAIASVGAILASKTRSMRAAIPDRDRLILIYIIANYLANWLPWALVSRCQFSYHYLGSQVFSILALAWWLDRGFSSPKIHHRLIAIAVVFLITVAFLFWLPVSLGLPLSEMGFRTRMWFRSWI